MEEITLGQVATWIVAIAGVISALVIIQKAVKSGFENLIQTLLKENISIMIKPIILDTFNGFKNEINVRFNNLESKMDDEFDKMNRKIDSIDKELNVFEGVHTKCLDLNIETSDSTDKLLKFAENDGKDINGSRVRIKTKQDALENERNKSIYASR